MRTMNISIPFILLVLSLETKITALAFQECYDGLAVHRPISPILELGKTQCKVTLNHLYPNCLLSYKHL